MAASAPYDDAEKAAGAKEFQKAESILRDILRDTPDDERARFLLARVLSWSGKQAEALDEYGRLLAVSPENADYLLGRAQTLWWTGRPLEAIEAVNRGLYHAPEYEYLWRLKLKILAGMGPGRKAEALRLQNAAAARFPMSEWDEVKSGDESVDQVTIGGLPQGSAVRRTEIEAGYMRERFDNDFEDWTSAYLDMNHSFSKNRVIYGNARRTERFSREDTELMAGAYHPLSSRITLNVEGSASATHNILPEWSAAARIQAEVARGLLLHAGARRTEYGLATVDLYQAEAEAYISIFRVAYTLYHGQVREAGSSYSHLFQVNLFYGGGSSVGAGFSTGKEIESLGGGRAVTFDVREYSIIGRHWFTDKWAVTYEAVRREQGESYVKDGIRAGIRRKF